MKAFLAFSLGLSIGIMGAVVAMVGIVLTHPSDIVGIVCK